ncbi:MAG: alpha/beta fold hydrolase [Wenzhouxiangella sp.]|nr:MAG: alpha/beta fold hydrolase [Wenzhouxiangella sp.]
MRPSTSIILLLFLFSVLMGPAAAEPEPAESLPLEPATAEAAEDEAGLLLDPDPDAVEAGMVGEPAEELAEITWLRADGFDPVICPFRGRIDYGPGEIECGLIRVPENRERPDSRTIELLFVRLVARGEDAEGEEVEVRDDPVIYLTGGPGVTVEGYVARLKDHGLLARRDLYILEQRGIGNSGDFCPFFATRNRADQIWPTFAESQLAMMRQAEVCMTGAAEAGVDIAAYHTFENARDVKAMRMALGLDSWNVWGISYGSVLGQAYIKVDPEGIAAVVLDAIVPLDLEELMRIPHWHDRNLEMLFAACAGQPGCQRQFEDLRERYMAAMEKMIAEPVGLDVEPDERYPDGRVYFFQDLIAGLPFSLLYDESTHPAVPAIIAGLTRAVERNDQRLFRALALAEGDSGGFSVSMGMSMAVRCLDGYIDRWAESAPGDFIAYPTLARSFGDLDMIARAPELCRQVGLVPRDPADFALVETDLPIVVANGAWDPITPVPLAEYIMPGFANGRLAIFPHAGHGPTRSVECAGDFMNDFFDDPQADLDQDCVEEGGEAAKYLAGYFRTAAVPRGIVMQAERERRFHGHLAWAGVSWGLSLLGLLVLPAAWVSRRLGGAAIKGAGSTRFLIFLGTLAVAVHLIGLGLAARATAEITEAMMLFGLVPWAVWFAWLAPLALLFGLGGLIQGWRYRERIAAGARIGLFLTGLATLSASLVSLVWGLWPLFS